MTIERVHLVYPHGDRASAPDVIGRELGRHLGRDLEVVFHDWAGFELVPAAPEAAIVGHAHPVPGTTFRRSVRRPGWGRRVLLQPFITKVPQVGYIAGVLPHVDRFLAITGRHWERVLPDSAFASIAPVFTQLDLAVDASAFPMLVTKTRPCGSRRILAIGRDVAVKNLAYLEEIAARRPEWDFARIGPKGPARSGIVHLGEMDFRDPVAQSVLASFDVLVNVGRADANPTTVLEAMAWGLVPVCTPQSGYEGYEGIVNIPLDDPVLAVAELDRLQDMPDPELAELRTANRRRIEEHYTWERFAAVVRTAIEDPASGRVAMAGRRRWACSARWWATSLAPSNRAGLTDAARNAWRRPRR